ncbi:MAG: aminotransferase class I/II-fold pyridoxal phosphate-dependent enzyme [Caldimonas sp.]
MPTRLALDLTQQEAIPAAGVAAALALLHSGRMHRYGETGGAPSEVSSLEAEFARALGTRYGVALNSCGSAMFVALRAAGVRPGDAVLSNCFTLAPVPGAIAHAGARPVLVDVTDDYTIDLDDLEAKAIESGARTLLLSHMRGHICDMERLSAICRRLGVQLIEDCAHTMGASWAGRRTGTWGRAGCFSLQSYKHANSGEGGLLVTDDEDVAAQAILLSGSYMLYASHLSRPSDAVFERWKYVTPNFSLRMSNLAAAIARPQLGAALDDRCRRWNQRYAWLSEALAGTPRLRLCERPPNEEYVASSIQFSLVDMTRAQRQAFIAECAARGVHVKWFGADEPVGFTSVWQHWRFFGEPQSLPNAEHVLAGLCDMRLPLALSEADCLAIAQVIREAMSATLDTFELSTRSTP